MLLRGLFVPVLSMVEALVLQPVSNISPHTVQDSAADVVSSLETNSPTLSENSSLTPTHPDLSIAIFSLASTNYFSVRCDPRYGRDLNQQSCLSAIEAIDFNNQTQVTWGPRDTGMIYDVPMPRRWVSGELLAAELAYQIPPF